LISYFKSKNQEVYFKFMQKEYYFVYLILA
jgi:hypothetical protein